MIPRFKPWLGWPELLALFRRNSNAVERFERAFADKFGAVDAVAFPYGRSALWAFLQAVGVSRAEVVMPAYTCSVVAHAITLSGNTPRFVDIRLSDYNMDLDLLAEAIDENTRAVVATHLFGYPQDLDRVEAIVAASEARYGSKIWLIQDCAHSFGASWRGRLVGTSGDVGLYALNISKTMTAIFGGMLTFQDQELADQVRVWRDQHFRNPGFLKAWRRRIYLLAVYVAFAKPIYRLTWWLQERTALLNGLSKSYHLDDKIHMPPDFLEKMADVEAAVGLVQLRRYPAIVARRRANAEWYDRNLPRREGWVFPPIVDGATYSHYVVRVPSRHDVVASYADKGLHLGELIQYAIPLLSDYLQIATTSCPAAEAASAATVNFPVQPDLSTGDLLPILGKSHVVDSLANLHVGALTANDFSSHLGAGAIRKFYESLLENRHGRVFYEENGDREIVSICCVFHDYAAFNRRLIVRLAPLVLMSCFGGRIEIGAVLDRLRSRLPGEILPIADWHLGMIIANSRFGRQASASFRSNYTKSLSYLRGHGVDQLWGATLLENVRTANFLLKSGFEPAGDNRGIRYYKRAI
jgi:dTDP-4-amino-4,6-dideoxygalactose transaminase